MYHYSNFKKNQKPEQQQRGGFDNQAKKNQSLTKAVALGYEEDVDPAPIILGSGNGVVAEKILAIANEHNIPIHQDADLVEILSVLDINEYIPLEVYSIVAEIFSYIHEHNEKKKQNKLRSV